MKSSNLPTEKNISREPLPRSKKIYVKGRIHDVNVAMREIETDDEVEIRNGSIKKEKFRLPVYDTSGPYTDPAVEIDVHHGLNPLRKNWIEARNDTEQLAGYSSAFTKKNLNGIHSGLKRKPRRAKNGANVTQMHYARKGMITPEMEYIAIRENQRADELKNYYGNLLKQHKGENFGAKIPAAAALLRNLCVMKLRAVAPLFRIISIILKVNR